MIRRAWRVLADPPASDLAFFLRNFALPVGAALFVARVLVTPALGPGLTELAWMVVVLIVARQRDEARTRLRQTRDAARAALNDLPGVQASGHQDSAVRPSTTATAPPAPQSAPDPRRRNEDI